MFDPNYLLTKFKTDLNSRKFRKDEHIVVRPGLVYVVLNGILRVEDEDGTIIRFVDRVFEIIQGQSVFVQTESAEVAWYYWNDLTIPQTTYLLQEMRRANLNEMIWRSIVASTDKVETKVQKMVAYLYETFDTELPLTHKEIAAILGTTRVTVTRAKPVLVNLQINRRNG